MCVCSTLLAQKSQSGLKLVAIHSASMSPKRKLMDNMPEDPSVVALAAQAVSRHVNRRTIDGITVRAIQEHFPSMTQLYMTQHKVNGLTIVEYVLQAKTECKKTKGKKLGSAFWLEVRNLYADVGLVFPDLQVKDPSQPLSETLVKAIDQARTANCTKRSQPALLSWLQTAEAVNQREFAGIAKAKHAMSLKVNSNQAQPRALNQYRTQT